MFKRPLKTRQSVNMDLANLSGLGLSNMTTAGASLVVCDNQENRLTLDGPSERIAKAVISAKSFEEESLHKAVLINKEEEARNLKQGYVKAFIEGVSYFFKIRKESVLQLLRNLSDDDIKKIDEDIARSIKPKALLRIYGFGITALVSVSASIIMFFYGLEGFFLGLIGSVLSLLFIGLFLDSVFGEPSEESGWGSYFSFRRKFQKEFGKDYFPFDVLRAQLSEFKE